MADNNVTLYSTENEEKLLLNDGTGRGSTLQRFTHKNDVLLSKVKKSTYEKGFTPNWTEEVFTIATVKAAKPQTCTIKDTVGEPIQGTFFKFLSKPH